MFNPKQECLEAAVFFDRMAQVDKEVAEALNKAHADMQAEVNARRKKRPPYEIGDWVFLRRPAGVGGNRLQSYWRGPFKVLARKGADSYVIRESMQGPLDVHGDQLKLCIWDELRDPGELLQYPPE